MHSYDKNDLKKAIKEIKIALSIDNNPYFKFIAGAVYYTNKDYHNAIANLKENLKSDPENLDSLMFLARCYNESDKKKDALNAIINALKIAPNYPDAIKLKVNILMDLGRNYEALSELKKVVKIDQIDPEIYFNMATIYLDLRQYDKALKSINEAKRVSNGEDDQIYELSANIYARLHNYEAAISDLDNAIKYYDEEDSSLYLEKAAILDKAGKFDDALSLLNNILEKDSEDSLAFFLLIRVLIHSNRMDKLMEIVEESKLNNDIKDVLNMFMNKNYLNNQNDLDGIVKIGQKYIGKDNFEANLFMAILLEIYEEINSAGK
jgi:tetratricopeptide (TPR) repeat protein